MKINNPKNKKIQENIFNIICIYKRKLFMILLIVQGKTKIILLFNLIILINYV